MLKTRYTKPLILVGAVTLAVCVWAVIFLHVREARDGAINQAKRDTRNLAIAFEEHLNGILDDADARLGLLKKAFETDRDHFDFNKTMSLLPAPGKPIIKIAMADANGDIWGSTHGVTNPPTNVADRSYHQLHKLKDSGELNISEPIFGRVLNQWTMVVSRRLNDATGGFAGIVGVTLDPVYLSSFFDKINLGDGGVICVVGLDGVVRARAGLGTEAPLIGATIANAQARFGAVWTGSAIGASEFDGVERISSFRRLAGYPLVVVVATSVAHALVGEEAQVRNLLAAGGVLTIALFGLAALMIRAIQVREARDLALRGIAMNLPGVMYQSRRAADGSNFRFDYLSDRSEEYFGCTPKEAYDDPERYLRSIDPEDRRRVESSLYATPPVGRTWRDSYRVVVNGKLRWMSESNWSRRAPDQSIVNEGVAIDITDLKERERELEEAQRRAEEANRAKSAFLANMSHELRTPLNAIMGYSEVIRDRHFGADDPRYPEYAGLIHKSGAHLLSIINDLLDLSRIDAGRFDLEESDVDVPTLIDDAMVLVRPMADARGIHIERTIAIKGVLKVDRRCISQAIVNVISNAIKFTPIGGRIHVAFALRGDRPSVTITDNGRGIGVEHMKRIFEPFHRGDPAIRHDSAGTGLGLPICKVIMEAHGGGVDVRSAPGEGTTVILTLPKERATRLQAA